jgi:methionine-rich copper-binding protein CopC
MVACRAGSRPWSAAASRGRRSLLTNLIPIMGFRLRTLLVAAALALFWCLGVAPTVAHTELQATSPQQGAVLDAAPKEVRLTFTEALSGGSLGVAVSGRSAGAGAARVDGTDMVLEIAPQAPAGVWTVAYRVVSADGHPVTGQFTFTVKPQPPTSAPTPADTPSTTTSPTAGSKQTPSASPTGASSGKAHETPAVEVAVTVLALVALVVGVFIRRRRP